MYKLVIVDDEPWVAADLIDSIVWEKLGFEVDKIFHRSGEACAYICEENPAVVLTDIRMPVLDGLALIRQCKQSGCTSHFIILSAHKDFSYARQAIQLGVVDYSPKPIVPQELEQIFLCLRQILDAQTSANADLQEPESDSFEDMLVFIRENLQTKLSLQEIGDTFFVNRNYVCNLFKKRLGVTFSHFINEERLIRAKRLLCHSDMTLAEIAARVGFKDEFYLSKVFKKYENISPGLYRKLNH